MATVNVTPAAQAGPARDERAKAGEVVRSIAFYAAFYVGTMAYLVAALAALTIGGRGFGRVTQNWARYHRGCMRVLLGIRVEVSGPAPPAGSLLAIKHESFFEAIELPILFGNPAVFAKASLLRIPFWGGIARAYGLIPVEREQGAKALRAMLAAARVEAARGRPMAIFPEGTRVPHGTAPPLRSGFAAMYKLLSATVVPVAVESGPLYHRRWKRAGTIHVRIGEPIGPGLRRQEIEARVVEAINALN